MKRVSVLFLILAFALAACTTVVYPESGTYYCEELDMTWDFGSNYASYAKEGVEYLLTTEIGRDGHVTICRRSDYVVVLEGEFSFDNNVVSIKTDGGTIYNYVLVQ